MIDALSNRDLLIALGGLVLFIVIVDGIRRLRIASRSKIRISKSVHREVPVRHDDDYNPELPNGGARAIRDMNDLEASLDLEQAMREEQLESSSSEDMALPDTVAETTEYEPEFESEQELEPVMELESEPEPEPEPEPESEPESEPEYETNKTIKSANEDALTDYSVGESFWDEPQAPIDIYASEQEQPLAELEPPFTDDTEAVSDIAAAVDDEVEEPLLPEQEPLERELKTEPETKQPSKPKFVASDEQLSFSMDEPDQWDLESFSAEARYQNALDDIDQDIEPPVKKAAKTVKPKRKKEPSNDVTGGLFTKIKELFAVEDEPVKQHDLLEEPQKEVYKGPTEVLVIHVMAKQNGKIYGDDLLQALLANGMRLGDKNIFHRMTEADVASPVFSCANAINPGTFNLKTIEQISTPGISFFVALPNPEDSMYAFEEMAIAAGNIAARLGAEMQDDTRSAMTKQTLEHYKQKVLDFERRRRMRVV